MKSEEVLKILNEDLELWARIMGVFSRESDWYKEALAKVKALRFAISAIKDKEYLEDHCIEYGKDYWSDMYSIDEKIWATEAGVPIRNSFSIRPLDPPVITVSSTEEDDGREDGRTEGTD